MADQVWLDVLPSMVGFSKDLIAGTTKAATTAGSASGAAFSGAFENKAGDGGTKAFTDKLVENEKRAEKAVRDATTAIGGARANQKTAAAAVITAENNLAKAVEKYGEESKEAEAAGLKLSAAREKQTIADSKFEQAEIAIKAAHKESTEAAEQLTNATNDLNKSVDKGAARAEKKAQAMGTLKGAMKSAAVGAAATFAVLATGGKVLYDVGEKFDDMSDTIRVGTGATGKALDGLVDSAKTVATSVPTDFETASATVADLNTRMGLTGETLQTVASQVIEAGKMMGKELDINTVTGAFSAFNITGEETTSAMDHLFRVSQATGKGMDELAAAAQAQAPAMKALGFNYEQTTSMIGLMDRAGINSKAVMAGMSKGLVEMAKDGEKPVEAFQRVSSEIEGYVKSGDKAKALELAAGIFGTKGATQFVGAIESGSLALDAFSDSGLSSSDSILGAAADTHDFAEAWQMFKNDVLVKIEPIATKVFGAIGDAMKWISDTGVPAVEDFAGTVSDRVQPAFETFGSYISDTIIPNFQSTLSFIKDNKDWITAIGVSIGTVVAAWGAWKLATSAWQTVTKIATTVQAAFNLVMSLNPIMVVVTAVAALVAGLVYFFTQTETGQKIWEKFTSALTSAWQATTDALGAAWQWVQDAFKAGWDWIKENVIQKFVDGWNWVVEKFTAVKDALGRTWDKVKDGLKAGWDWIYDKVIQRYINAWNNLRDTFSNVKDSLLGVWDKVKDGLKAGWDWIGDKVFSPMKKGVSAIGKTFEKTKDIIGTAWDMIKEVAAKPVNFIIETVYTKGIKGVWDKIAGKVGLDLKLPTVNPIKFASGGVLPGYTPGRDVHRFVSPTAGVLDLSGGEGIMRPEWVRAMGGAAGVARQNAMAIAGTLPHQAFAGGGVWDTVKSGAKKAWGWTAATAGKTWDWTKNTAQSVGNFLSDPIAALAELIGTPVNNMMKTMAPGFVGDILKQVPGRMLDGLGSWVQKALFGRELEGSGERRTGGGSFNMGYQRMVSLLKGQFPDLRITSTYRPGAMTATGYPSMHGSGRAVDMAPRWDVFNWLRQAYPNSYELIYSPAGSRQLFKGQSKVYGEPTKSMHYNHIHWAMANGGTLPKNLNFGTYDTGGVLPPGDTLVSNKTGLPELILNPQQIDNLGKPRGPIDLSERSIEALADEIAEKLGIVGDTVREVKDAIDGARRLERMH